jgi:hypothetical protein
MGVSAVCTRGVGATVGGDMLPSTKLSLAHGSRGTLPALRDRSALFNGLDADGLRDLDICRRAYNTT